MSVDERLKELHARIDEDFEVKRVQLEEERRERHEALDKLWPVLAPSYALPSVNSIHIEPATPSNGSPNEKRKPFPMRHVVSRIIDKLEEGAEISQPQIYDELMERFPELKEEPPLNMRAQIASVLNWLTKKERIVVAKEGRGNYPNVYRKPTGLELAFPEAYSETKQSVQRENS